jgi:hypothetical protein
VNSTPPEPEDPLLRALARFWDDIEGLAGDEQRESLRQIVAGIADPDPVNARAAVADLLLDMLPPDHPVVPLLRDAMLVYDAGASVTATAENLARSWLRLRELVLPPQDAAATATPAPAGSAASEPPALSEFDRRVQSRLLGLPAVSPAEVRDRNVNPDGGGLIRLPRPDREVQLPVFQFAGNGEPWPAVQAVNERLDAAADPWGVTCWWVDPHAGLGAAPAELLGTGQDELLLQAAASVGDG